MMVFSGYKTFPIAAIVLLQAAACSTLPASARQYDNFTEYAEAVFRHQNDLSSRLMMIDPDMLPDNDSLEMAEEAMNDACHLLNEYAERESSGESMGLFFKREVQASIENCDLKIQSLEAMLTGIGK
ncbi:hypothetical protein [Methylomonas sp. LL1]|uniref:hypothetical protein n=1 Tax=Methylomonas sp. LL1 TaxID=2785785 RepID=UPI001E5359A6|nr:hypothetical protein [Methylomonas sp. LL1]